VRFLLDENFPLQLHRRLVEAGHHSEHIIALGQRGVSDAEIRRRLAGEEDLVFLTQDTEFEELSGILRGTVIISRIPQSRPIADRVGVWFAALETFVRDRPDGRLFDLLETGVVEPRR
jgi:hypothetical protein